jgi:hypothetical protein
MKVEIVCIRSVETNSDRNNVVSECAEKNVYSKECSVMNQQKWRNVKVESKSQVSRIPSGVYHPIPILLLLSLLAHRPFDTSHAATPTISAMQSSE